jgi:hypothetical protein
VAEARMRASVLGARMRASSLLRVGVGEVVGFVDDDGVPVQLAEVGAVAGLLRVSIEMMARL